MYSDGPRELIAALKPSALICMYSDYPLAMLLLLFSVVCVEVCVDMLIQLEICPKKTRRYKVIQGMEFLDPYAIIFM